MAGGINTYSYALNNPQIYADISGLVVETPWDILNVSVGAAETVTALKNGRFVYAGVSAVATCIDIAAVVVPGVPGGASTALKASEPILDAITKRPKSFRRGTVKDSWDEAKDGASDNSKLCPTCGKEVFGNPHKKERRDGPNGWDVDHQPPWSTRTFPDATKRKDVLDDYNTGTRLECRSCNRSRGAKPAEL